jgi:hypothetical protein
MNVIRMMRLDVVAGIMVVADHFRLGETEKKRNRPCRSFRSCGLPSICFSAAADHP